MKGKFSNSLAAVSLRKGLVVFQFIISGILIIAFVIIASQRHYLRSADLEFDNDRQIVIPLRSDNALKIYVPFKDELKTMPMVANVGASYYNLGIPNTSDKLFYKEGESME